MKAIKRVEIVIETVKEDDVIQLLSDIGIEGYTLYHHVGGSGESGVRESTVFGDKFENVAFVIACNESNALKLTDAIRPLLKQYGGMCLVSDANWVVHNN